MARSVFYHVHEHAVQAFVMPGGEVEKLVNRVVRNTFLIAQVEAPVRSGTLLRGLGTAKAKPGRGPWRTSGRVSSSAAHSLYVHDGTGTITPDNGDYLVIPKTRGAISGQQAKAASTKGNRLYFIAKSISGQQANPFLANSLKMAMAREGSLDYTRG